MNADSATVTWTAPTTDEYAISSYTVHMLDEEFPCNSSPCTIDTSALNVTDDTKVSAYVVVNYAEDFVKPFPVEASPELPALETICDGVSQQSQKLFDAI